MRANLGRIEFPGRLAVPVCLLLLLAAGSPAGAEASAASDGVSNHRSPFVQEEQVQLVLLDVVVKDAEGKPVPGLTKDDFRLKLNYRSWPVYSVDDMCADARSGEGAAAGPAAGGSPSAGSAPITPPSRAKGGAGSANAVRYVLYFDFSQLPLDGRKKALDEAVRWVREVKRPADEVMIEAYSTAAGLRMLAPFTADASRLLHALLGAYSDPALIDPFPSLFDNRIDECYDCIRSHMLNCIDSVCKPNAIDEFRHGRAALKSLEYFMVSLSRMPGRKAVIFMHENTTLSPGRFYPIAKPEDQIGEHSTLLEQVGAEATSARVSLYPIYFGDTDSRHELFAQAVNVGDNLADFTGGKVSRAPYFNARTMRDAGRDEACAYRIAFKPPHTQWTQRYIVKVIPSRGTIPYTYRAQFLSEPDRVMREALAVLDDPEAHKDLDVSAALAPGEMDKGKWSATVRIALDLSSLQLLPEKGMEAGHLDVGAVLENVRTGKTWEMLGGTDLKKAAGEAAGGVILYERRLSKLKHGTYRLRAFVRNKGLDLYGGAEAEVDLPGAEQEAFVGPVASCPGRAVYPTDLPLEKESARAGVVVHLEKGAPPHDGALRRGEPLELDSWICPSGGLEPGKNLLRLVEQDGAPLYKLPEGRIENAGSCERFTDLLDTSELSPGSYTYLIQWLPAPGARPVSRSVDFTVAPGPVGAVARTADERR